MAVMLEKKYLKGKCYWYASEKKRVNGKVKRVFQKYLGSQEQCLARLLSNESALIAPDVFTYGAVMALLGVVQKLDLVDVIDTYMQDQVDKDTRFYHPQNPHLPSLGTYLVLAAINRCIASTSKRDMYNWFKTTSLKRHWPHLTPHAISSQCFWEAMQTFTERHLQEMTQLITERVFHVYADIDRSCLLLDQTNYYTFIDTFNQRNTLAQRGKNKQKRNNLRQVGYLLMVTKDSHIPVFYLCYQGNHNDITVCKDHLTDIIATAKTLTQEARVTMVFDTGNVSKQVMHRVQKELYFVTSLVSSEHKPLLEECLAHGPMRCIRPKTKDQDEILAYVTRYTLWGQEHKIVIGYSPSFFEAQKNSLLLQLRKAEQKLSEIQQMLSTYKTHKRGSKPTLADLRTRIDHLLKHDRLNQLISYTLSGTKYITLTFQIEHEKVQHYLDLLGGKTIHITNHPTWSALDIIQAYRDQAGIEDAIKETKGIKHSVWWPLGHWTDQKIQVHGFYTFVALLLKSLVQKTLHDHGIRRCWHAVVSDLDDIYEVVELVYEKGQMVPRIRLSNMTEQQAALSQALL